MGNKLEILTYDDGMDCELCGLDTASGGTVLLNGVEILDYPGFAHCYSRSSYEVEDIWHGINDECALGVTELIDPEQGWDCTFVQRCVDVVKARGWELVAEHDDFEWGEYEDYPGQYDDDNCWCNDEETCNNCNDYLERPNGVV
ncbi:hypothetical protein VPHD148_0128 [Vibrio phage D148]